MGPFLTGTSGSVTENPSGVVNLPKIRPKVYYNEDDTFFIRKTLEDNPKLPTNSNEEERLRKPSLLDWTISITLADEVYIYFSDLSDEWKIGRNP
jgi:hypothetical protein